MGEVKGRLEVHLNHLVPHLLGHTHQQGVTRDAGVIDQNIQSSEIRHHLLYHLVRRLKICGIGGIELYLHT